MKMKISAAIDPVRWLNEMYDSMGDTFGNAPSARPYLPDLREGWPMPDPVQHLRLVQALYLMRSSHMPAISDIDEMLARLCAPDAGGDWPIISDPEQSAP